MPEPIAKFTKLNGKEYYKIENYESMEPFFINIASASDLWLFASSLGGITAGRRNSGGALFPYETEDKLHSQAETGSRTIIRRGNKYWEPFERTALRKWRVSRSIYKSLYGDCLLFEEINHDMQLCFSYSYSTSESYGIVKTSMLSNMSDNLISAEILDGLQNLMPHGVDEGLQAGSSTLVDAYKANEFADGGRLAVYSMTTQINDSPSAVEVLRGNVAWCTCENADISLDGGVIRDFCNDRAIDWAKAVYGKKGGYFVHYTAGLAAGESAAHSIIADSAYSHDDIARLEKQLSGGDYKSLFKDIDDGAEKLAALVGKADGIQSGGDRIACSHHYMNTLYNIMRGGIFQNAYDFDYDDFVDFVKTRNKELEEKIYLLPELSGIKTVHELKEISRNIPQLYRLALEYMPLSFSRRHGDPSRPWNKFNISLKDAGGKAVLRYEGNWRDIFQNWEALGLSYPCYYENMLAKFVNATTIDGFNPYRINRDGIDWEKVDEDNPFGGFGYWSDHQIIYLLRLLYGLEQHFPHSLKELLTVPVFSYANIPYRLHSYNEILKDSKNTIDFDFKRDREIERLCDEKGSDARLVQLNGAVYMVSLAEKLLVILMSKISNLLPGGGIWMNTQRPEWNDANNTIVGIGLSMVTVYHLYAYIVFMQELMGGGEKAYELSAEVGEWLENSQGILQRQTAESRDNAKETLDLLGRCFSDYREKVYDNGFSGKLVKINAGQIKAFLSLCLGIVEKTIENNRNEIYTSYNLLDSSFACKAMRPMLEGQSAVIGSGILDAAEVCELVGRMENILYSSELKAHYLYPVKKTTEFVKRNIINESIRADGKIIIKDSAGFLRFAPFITRREELENALPSSEYTKEEQTEIIKSFENTFGHSSFTGRSEVMYKFEGIGCVYWHQNAKLALGVQEAAVRARLENKNAGQAYDCYRALTGGFIYRKSPKECGAFPLEPYSHTSYNMKSEQPGMTGQVKESLLMRRTELGVFVRKGEIIFDSWFIHPDEFDENGNINFTICRVPVEYSRGKKPALSVQMENGSAYVSEDLKIPADISRLIFERKGSVKSIAVKF